MKNFKEIFNAETFTKHINEAFDDILISINPFGSVINLFRQFYTGAMMRFYIMKAESVTTSICDIFDIDEEKHQKIFSIIEKLGSDIENEFDISDEERESVALLFDNGFEKNRKIFAEIAVLVSKIETDDFVEAIDIFNRVGQRNLDKEVDKI